MSERRFLLILSIPLVVVVLLFIGWQQGLFDPCEACGGSGWVWPPRIPEDPLNDEVPCDQCSWSGRVNRMARSVDRALPEGPERLYFSISAVFLAVLAWGLRTVRCGVCGGGAAFCGSCGGRGRTTRLDLWVNPRE